MNAERGGIIFKFLFLLFFILFCAVVYLLRGPILRAAAHVWITEDALQKSDAILLLSDDNFAADRATHAAFLYRAQWAPLIVASGRQLRPYAGLAEIMEHDLIQRGVPRQAILRLPHGGENTREESQELLKLVTERKWTRVIVVTSDVDVRRARYIYLRVFPETVVVRVSGARDLDFDAEHWWESRRGVKRMYHEVAGMLVAIWELRHSSARGEQAQSLVALCGTNPLLIV